MMVHPLFLCCSSSFFLFSSGPVPEGGRGDEGKEEGARQEDEACGGMGWSDHYCTALQPRPYRTKKKKRATLIHDGHVCPRPMAQYSWVREDRRVSEDRR